ncbi:MAG: xanthine dehydrogenase family protein molybdopterin-binding subunit [Nitrososphaerota archaeon]|nr:xanthine dehydrogenase family protein molybdopterin-binding subunit [Nitrososphaerota archaeon]MDG6940119.1 xanthine dehydrogenase family protein molybdopterin-binding subunit [Nitrososphaerota archaeon]
MLNYRWIQRPVPNPLGEEKATGVTRFFSDMFPQGCLMAKTVRSPHPRAKVKGIDVSQALRGPGVQAIVTAKDIQGLNAYGVFFQEAPVLASTEVNYVGEPLALVAAETEEQAEAAAEAVRVDYEQLPFISSMEEALGPDAPNILPDGNIARHCVIEQGDYRKALAESHLVVKNTYRTQKQKHMYLEPEAGMGYLDEAGVLNLFVGGQNPYRDRLQIARSVGLPKEKIRVVNFPVGGAFGGKDEITLQIHLALLVLKTRRAVKLVWSREESGAAGYSRHAFKMDMETGVGRDGKLTANRAVLFADTGPYMSFGPSVMDVAMETVNGPYIVPHYFIEGTLVRTNNGMSAAFRGFGAPQANFAVESQMNIIAEELGLDKLELREKNIWRSRARANFGHELGNCEGLRKCLEKASRSALWKYRGNIRPARPWLKSGVGVAVAMKGIGFGVLPDYPAAAVEVHPEGHVTALFSNPDYGQGLIVSNAQLVAEKFGISPSLVKVSNADTNFVPDTGGSSASRSTYTSGGALLDSCDKAIAALKVVAADALHTRPDAVTYSEGMLRADAGELDIFRAAGLLKEKGAPTKFVGTFAVPRFDSPVSGSLEIPHMVHSFAALLGEVEVDTLLGTVRVKRLLFYPDIGRVINPVIASAQCDGGLMQGLGYAIMEEHVYDASVPKTRNFTTYLVPCPTDSPVEIGTEFVESTEATGPFGAKGVGEIPIIPVASCLADAVRDATGVRLKQLPMSPGRVLSSLPDQKPAEATA